PAPSRPLLRRCRSKSDDRRRLLGEDEVGDLVPFDAHDLRPTGVRVLLPDAVGCLLALAQRVFDLPERDAERLSRRAVDEADQPGPAWDLAKVGQHLLANILDRFFDAVRWSLKRVDPGVHVRPPFGGLVTAQ